MLRCIVAAVAVAVSGCATTCQVGRFYRTPTDKDAEKVAMRLASKVPASIERHTQVEGWARDRPSHAMTRDTHGTEWTLQFDETTEVGRRTKEFYSGILTAIRADVLAAVESTGVEVTSASPVEFRDGASPFAQFEIRYLRKDREVAGEVVGTIEAATASSGPDTRDTGVRVRQSESYCPRR